MPTRRKPAVVAKPKPSVINCPFSIVIDKQEKHPFTFQNIPSNSNTNNVPFQIETAFEHLSNLGDYTIRVPGYENGYPRIMVERKSLGDLYVSMGKRENWEWRLGMMCEECEYAAVVCEADWAEIFENPPVHQITDGPHITPTIIHRTIQSWTDRFPRVHWFLYPGRDSAEVGTFWLLYRFYENIKEHKSNRDRKQANYKAYYEGMIAFKKKVPNNQSSYPRKHAFGDLADFWLRGWLDAESVALDRPFTAIENLPAQLQ